MSDHLPPNLLALFTPRNPIKYLPPACKLPHEKKTGGYLGVGQFLHHFEDPKDAPPPIRLETKEERLQRRKREQAEQVAYKLEQKIALWVPGGVSDVTDDPFKTLFVARINYETTTSKLRREFESYGPVKKIAIIHSKVNGKPRGYAFIEYEEEKDMKSAYKHADGKKIDGHRVLVDVQRGGTTQGWLPRKLGGGLGGTRRGCPEVNVKHSGREDNVRERDGHRSERGIDGDRDRKRRSRSRSRDRKRRRSRDRDDIEEIERIERPRERRDRDRDRKRRARSKSGDDREHDRERKRERRDKDRDRRDHKDRRDRRNRDRRDEGWQEVRVKEEPIIDYDYPEFYNSYSNADFYNGNVKSERDDQEYEEKYRIPETYNRESQ